MKKKYETFNRRIDMKHEKKMSVQTEIQFTM